MLNILHVCLLKTKGFFSKQNIDSSSSLLMSLVGIKVLWRALLRRGYSKKAVEMAVWKAGRFCAPANYFHTCPIGFKLPMAPRCATCRSDCLIDLIVACYVKGKRGTFTLPDVSASFILHLNKSTLYLFNGRMLICFLLCFLKLILTS